jgi:predicted AAA+ superfamily ATPase
MGVKTGCRPRDDVLEGELNDAIFAASFGRLIRDEGPAVYREPTLFFRNAFPTDALCALCRRGFRAAREFGGSWPVLAVIDGSGAARRMR